MANPQTTHVIEIETGIGEPAFIPLSLGHELQPISVGKKGMWRIESPRVLDVHAFVYFDGTSLFLQSADESNSASVDGYRVGKAWTELHAPCKIEVGTARLRYRSLIEASDDQPTMMAPSPPVQAPPGGPGGPPSPTGSRPGAGASMPVAVAPPPPAPSGARLPQQGGGQGRIPTQQLGPGAGASSPPVAFPKAERPFKPGEFSAPQDNDESTRIAPLDATGAGRAVSGPRPAAGQPIGEDAMRAEAARIMRGQSGAVPAATGSSPFGAMPGMQGNMMGGSMPPGNAMQSGGYPEQQQQGYPQQQQQPQQGYPQQQGAYAAHGGYSNAAGSGAFNAIPQIPGPPGMPQGQLGPSMAPGGYGSMTPQGGMPPPTGAQAPTQGFVEKLKANSIPKIVAGILFVIGGILYLAEDDEPVQPKRKITASADAGVEAGTASGNGPAPTSPPVMAVTPAAPTTPAWPAGVPCPPPNWPPNTPLPCTPNAAGNPPDRTPPEKNARDAGAKESKDAGGPALPAGTKTLERQAVDFVASGDTARAAAAYEELSRRDPNNKVYAEAARILRAKLDGGAP